MSEIKKCSHIESYTIFISIFRNNPQKLHTVLYKNALKISQKQFLQILYFTNKGACCSRRIQKQRKSCSCRVYLHVTYVMQVLTFIFDEVVSHDDRQAM